MSIVFSEVHKARRKGTDQLVALKRILMKDETEGVPITALREIKILKKLIHPNIVSVVSMIVQRKHLAYGRTLAACSRSFAFDRATTTWR
jgi:serine/threonine protein kinase